MGQYIRGMVHELRVLHYSSYLDSNGKEVFIN